MTSLIILLLLFTSTSPTLSLSTSSSNSSPPPTTTIFSQICPSECDCEEITTDFKQSVTINCYNGGLNSTDFSKILENLSSTINILEIRAPASQPNSFEWNDNLNRFQRLERLSMINCGIPSISQSARLKSLQHLDLHGNHIDYLYMTTFAGLTSLELLDLSHNRLSNLPSGVFNLIKKLKFLNLAHNRLSTLATNLLLGPKNLHTLQLDGNKITAKQINEQFSDIKSLQRLEINDCGLGDDGISHLKLSKIENLKRLGVGGNNLTKVPSATLRNLPNLND
jgi:Leucine-rich repeat (LRR) protein